jgi:hypothetical protein
VSKIGGKRGAEKRSEINIEYGSRKIRRSEEDSG